MAKGKKPIQCAERFRGFDYDRWNSAPVVCAMSEARGEMRRIDGATYEYLSCGRLVLARLVENGGSKR